MPAAMPLIIKARPAAAWNSLRMYVVIVNDTNKLSIRLS